LCFHTWKLPIGRPNAWRSLPYRIASAIGVLYVDAWTAHAGRVRRRGEAVRLLVPEQSVVVELAS
jgi:hypothetical protein